jgi:hypothetical protein
MSISDFNTLGIQVRPVLSFAVLIFVLRIDVLKPTCDFTCQQVEH